jgi:hypothetical protein
MGNEASCGYGILNNTHHDITFGVSMGATYYYENDVSPGKIFYRWPGNVHMTLFAQISTESTRITDGKVVWETISVAGSSIAAAAAVVVSGGSALAFLTGPGAALSGLVFTGGQAAIAA